MKLNELDQHKLLVERAAGTERAFLEFCLPFKPWENKVPEFDKQVKEKLEGKNGMSSGFPDAQSIEEATHLGLSLSLGADKLGLRKKPLNVGRKSRGDRDINDILPTEEEIESWMSEKPLRKRDILGISRCLYDPHGFMPSVTCSLKLKYQEYLSKYGSSHQWNTICSSDVKQEFIPLLKSVLKAKLEVEVPRYIGKPVVKEEVVSTLIIVNDGKLKKAGYTMAYLHHEWTDDKGETKVECNLIASRNKLLPHTIMDQV